MSSALLGSAGAASAFQLTDHSATAYFDGTGTAAGVFGNTVESLAVDQGSGNVYVATKQAGLVVDKFDASGASAPFSDPALGGATALNMAATTSFGGLKVAVDNSNTATRGRIYLYGPGASKLWAFNPDGSPVGGKYPIEGNEPRDIAVDPTTGNLWIAQGRSVAEYEPDGDPTGRSIPVGSFLVTVDSDGNIYISPGAFEVQKFNSELVPQYRIPLEGFAEQSEIAADPVSNDLWEYGPSYIRQFSPSGEFVAQYSSPGEGRAMDINGTNKDVYVGSSSGAERVDIYTPGATSTLPDVSTGAASDFETTSVTLHGTVDPNGIATTECQFEVSQSGIRFNSIAATAECDEGSVLSGSGAQEVSAVVSGLTQGAKYNYRLISGNANGQVVGRQDETFAPSTIPTLGGAEWGSDVHSDSFTAHAAINPQGADTTYSVEYGVGDCATSECTTTSNSGDAGSKVGGSLQSLVVGELEPGTTYHYRVVATNQSGTGYGADHTITTYPYSAVLTDPCPNAHVRQQTGAALLPDCRAYELVSAANTGGYNVESDLVRGQSPFDGYPSAESRVLYGVHSGAIPGPWNPTNHGVDPYVATRGADGWSTKYVGIPANLASAVGPFASELSEADSSLEYFAFGGEGICSPCFEDGSTNVPLRLPNGSLVKGMAGSLNPVANPAGEVRQRFSEDGSHFVFGAEEKFEPSGNEGSVSIYERDLNTSGTEVVSTTPSGATMSGPGIAELGVSADGARVLVGKKVGEDSDGNEYFDLYMHFGSSPDSVQVISTESGVIYNGMTSDGSRVFFTTPDRVTGDDTDESPDFFRADVSASSVTITRLSSGTGGAGNSDDCEPVTNWNVVSGGPNCGTVAMAGGAGIASGDGTAYFVSPELLESVAQSEGIENQPNLYVSVPGQPNPRFVATIDSSLVKPGPQPAKHPLEKAGFLEHLKTPESLAVDETSGDLYVLERGTPRGVSRFSSTGAPDNFTAGPYAGTNKVEVPFFGGQAEAQVAVDNSGGPLDGDFYVSNGSNVRVFSTSGEEVGEIGELNYACGVAVDQSTGDLYVGQWSYEGISRLEPVASPTMPVTAADYVKTNIITQGLRPCQVGADTAGHAFASAWANGPLKSYKDSEFAPVPTESPGTLVDSSSSGVMTDRATGDLYVDERTQIAQYSASGSLIQKFGSGEIGSNSRGVAVNSNTGRVYATNGNSIVEFGVTTVPYAPIDNPAVVHGVTRSGSHDYGDFQVTPDGRFAVFSSVLPLTGYDTNGHSEVYRYDADGNQLNCASCPPTNARAEGDGTLGSLGLGLLASGNVFFDSTDALAPRDLDSRQDVYVWDGGSPKLISTGVSSFPSSLLGVSLTETDVYFFTKDTLVPQDENGTLVKIYDARANGGFPYVPPPVPCRASDECHGAGSPQPQAATINTVTGTLGNGPTTAPKPMVHCHRAGRVRRQARRCQGHQNRGRRRHGARGTR
jgi:hypothetical protein